MAIYSVYFFCSGPWCSGNRRHRFSQRIIRHERGLPVHRQRRLRRGQKADEEKKAIRLPTYFFSVGARRSRFGAASFRRQRRRRRRRNRRRNRTFFPLLRFPRRRLRHVRRIGGRGKGRVPRYERRSRSRCQRRLLSFDPGGSVRFLLRLLTAWRPC